MEQEQIQEVQNLIEQALTPLLKRMDADEYRMNSHKHTLSDLTQKIDFGSDDGLVILTDGATVALDASQGRTFSLTATGNRTIAVPSNPANGRRIIIRHYASGGARTLTLTTSAGGFRFGAAPIAIAATASGTMDYIGAEWNEIDGFWDVVSYATGY